MLVGICSVLLERIMFFFLVNLDFYFIMSGVNF